MVFVCCACDDEGKSEEFEEHVFFLPLFLSLLAFPVLIFEVDTDEPTCRCNAEEAY